MLHSSVNRFPIISDSKSVKLRSVESDASSRSVSYANSSQSGEQSHDDEFELEGQQAQGFAAVSERSDEPMM